jgi:hypothetical protein
MLDYLCREIELGDTLVYPVRRASRMYLQRLTVANIDDAANTVSGPNPLGTRVTIRRPDRSVVAGKTTEKDA